VNAASPSTSHASCGALALSYQTGELDTRDKPDEGPVTRADTEVNARIVSALREAFPDDDIIAEESGAEFRGRARCWYVDPIDGTTEYARGEDEWAVQIGLCIDGEPVLGVVHEAGAGRLAGACAGAARPRRARDGGVAAPLRPSDAAASPPAPRQQQEPRLAADREVMRLLAIPDDRNLRVGSTGVKMTAVARDVADLYVHPRAAPRCGTSAPRTPCSPRRAACSPTCAASR
jgi:3'-phosphoadenosine 5'-phosphosulfate (PAPS) 3'-phosphatase